MAANKKELFHFLTGQVEDLTIPASKMIYTSEDKVICKGTDRKMPRCDHEEADTWIIVHVRDSLQRIRTDDTDVIVILIGKFYSFCELNP